MIIATTAYSRHLIQDCMAHALTEITVNFCALMHLTVMSIVLVTFKTVCKFVLRSWQYIHGRREPGLWTGNTTSVLAMDCGLETPPQSWPWTVDWKHHLSPGHGLWTGNTTSVLAMDCGLETPPQSWPWTVDWKHHLSPGHGLWTGNTTSVLAMDCGLETPPQSWPWTVDWKHHLSPGHGLWKHHLGCGLETPPVQSNGMIVLPLVASLAFH